MHRVSILAGVVAAGLVAGVIGEARRGGPPPAQLRIEPVKPGLYAILNPGSNTLAVRVTNDGVLLVDDMFERNYDQIIALVKTVTSQPVEVRDQHASPWRSHRRQRPVPGARHHLRPQECARVDERTKPLPGPPPVTFTTERHSPRRREVQMHYLGTGHTNGDIVVYFPDLRVIAMGICSSSSGTSCCRLRRRRLDARMGADARTGAQVRFRHGNPRPRPGGQKADLQKYKDNLQTLHTRTRELIKQGVPKDQHARS